MHHTGLIYHSDCNWSFLKYLYLQLYPLLLSKQQSLRHRRNSSQTHRHTVERHLETKSFTYKHVLTLILALQRSLPGKLRRERGDQHPQAALQRAGQQLDPLGIFYWRDVDTSWRRSDGAAESCSQSDGDIPRRNPSWLQESIQLDKLEN